MLIVDIFDHAAFFQPGGVQSSRQRTVFFPKPLLVDEHSEALFEAELAGMGGFDLGTESVSHFPVWPRNRYSHRVGIRIHITPELLFTCPGIRTRERFDQYACCGVNLAAGRPG